MKPACQHKGQGCAYEDHCLLAAESCPYARYFDWLNATAKQTA